MSRWSPTDLLHATSGREHTLGWRWLVGLGFALNLALIPMGSLVLRNLARPGAQSTLWPVVFLVLAIGAWVLLLRGLFQAGARLEWEGLSSILLDNLLAHFPGNIYFKDRESRFVRISQAHVRHFRLEREQDAWGKTDLDMFSGEHGQQAMRDEQEIMRSGEPKIDMVEKETWADGRTAWASTSKLPLRNKSGEIIGTFGLSLDVTQQHQAEQALKLENTERQRAEQEAGKERDLLHALMDNIPDLIYFKDCESRYTRINRAHAAALGIGNPEAAVGRTDADYFGADFSRQSRVDESTLMTSGHALLGKVEHDARGNRWYLATKVPLKDASGLGYGLVGISKDITQRKLQEEKLDRDLETFREVVSAVAQGDLKRRGAEGDDTLGRIAVSVNQMIEGFTEILGEVRDAAFSVSTSASEILAAAVQIAKGAQYGSDEVHSTTAAVEEMATSMALVSRHAEQSTQSARQVLDHVRDGGTAVNATAKGMTRIDGAVSAAVEKMRLLEQRSKRIFEIIALIEEIASQSNLLSLNAAIEAAHAGDAGRGFGVVAEEIRSLADRSREATKDVTQIVEGIVDETRQVLAAMENGLTEVATGHDLSQRAQKSLDEIQALMQESAALIDQISHAAHEQVVATQTVSRAMQTIANVTHESSAGANETSKAVKDLVLMSEQLNRALARFKIDRAEG
jgi:PAS domain S-box-containing protein